jgi:predicted metal-dependent hydrolase
MPSLVVICIRTGHSTLDTQPRDSRLTHGVELFNEQEFFACHDVLEELWSETLDEDREFLQGLIHAAVALFHFGEGNLGGARKMHDSASAYLTPFRPSRAGIDVDRFLREFDRCFALLLGAQSGYPQGVQLDPTLIPELHWSSGSDNP